MAHTRNVNLAVVALAVLVVALPGCKKNPRPSAVTLRQHGGAASAVTLDRVTYSTSMSPANISANTIAEDRSGQHTLIAAIDEAGPNVKQATASAKHSANQKNRTEYVRFDVAGYQRGANADVKFEIRGSDWRVPVVQASPVGGGPPVANPEVVAGLYLMVWPDTAGVQSGVTGIKVPLRPVGGQKIEYPAITGNESGAGTLEPDTPNGTIQLKSGSTYTVEVIAWVHGQDIAGTNGYNARIIVAYTSLVVYHP